MGLDAGDLISVFETSRPDPARRVLAGVAIVALAVVAFAGGRVSAPDTPGLQTRAGVPVGYPPTEAGARHAAMTAGTVRARAELLGAADRDRLLQAIGEPRWVSRQQREIAALDLAPLERSAGDTYVVAALGGKTLQFEERRTAVVQVWFAQALGGRNMLRPGGSFITEDITLRWDETAGWRVTDIRHSRDQAVPEIAQPPTNSRVIARVMDGLNAPVYGP